MMECSGVWTETLSNGGIKIGVTDYHVSEFGGSDWEWSVSLNKVNKEILVKSLRSEFKEKLDLREMITQKFGRNLDTIAFVRYLDNLQIKYKIERTC